MPVINKVREPEGAGRWAHFRRQMAARRNKVLGWATSSRLLDAT